MFGLHTIVVCACACGTRSRVRWNKFTRFSFYSFAQLDYTPNDTHVIYIEAARRQQSSATHHRYVSSVTLSEVWVLRPHTRAHNVNIIERNRLTVMVRSAFTYDRRSKNTQLYNLFMCTQHNFTFLIKVFSVINFVAISRNNAVIGVTSKAIDTLMSTGTNEKFKKLH